MFPIRDDNPHFLTPYVTYALIGLNAGTWFFVQGLGTPAALGQSICMFGVIPAELLGTLPSGTRVALGPDLVCVIDQGSAWYTPVTSMFMHGGWFHLIANMWFLWIFGNNVEDAMGHLRFAVFYLLCGLAAVGAQVAAGPESAIPMVGASGAIGGVMGAYVLLYPRVNVHMLVFFGFIFVVAVPAVFMLGYWFLLQLIGGLGTLGDDGGGVAFWAHAGGFAAGMMLVPLFKNAALLRRHPYYGWRRRSASRGWRRVR
ncbi:rhomboid family intramembrane serine protease [Thioalkalivibrio denitrificans]|uniref:Rhomboid family intramembrane serine protease n=1 Tax=Thioalkalivibrio denitrificans TaxID=108003 RepID=A0A1V3N7J6_9GAMM|nr:rhomboid family intramembrane serine protease [Thioalkalivibrio denitrificans]OOG20776.1 rhomboid family intramembrane serine protease [Thioalkalivibrio denitrificans]